MRLFYRIDGPSNWVEIDAQKLCLMPGDIVYCHNQEVQDRLRGEALLTGIDIDVAIPGAESLIAIIKNSAILFFTKIPKSCPAPYRLSDSQNQYTIDFGKDWYES